MTALPPPQLASVSVPGRGATDDFLSRIVQDLMGQGLRLAGTVQSNTARPDRRKCDMDLRILPDGPVVRISEDRGDQARGCILDSGALEQTVADVARRLPGAQLLVVNKFGKRESEGRGMIPVIAEALDRGLPVLIGVNGLNLPDLRSFAGGVLQELPADPHQVLAWCRTRALPGRAPRSRPVQPRG